MPESAVLSRITEFCCTPRPLRTDRYAGYEQVEAEDTMLTLPQPLRAPTPASLAAPLPLFKGDINEETGKSFEEKRSLPNEL